MNFKYTGLILALTLTSACSPASNDAINQTTNQSANESTNEPINLTEAELHRHIAVLASDEFGGRAPATPGEKLTTDYLQQQFELLGI
ncbi:MAG: peptidase M28, partial [Pseudohongiella sp.]|nr:peptidase M28 [Pseudohongiella sp.]